MGMKIAVFGLRRDQEQDRTGADRVLALGQCRFPLTLADQIDEAAEQIV